MKSLAAPAKINLALVVGPLRPDGKHEVATVLQRIDLADRISLEPGSALEITGFADDTLVRDALLALANEAGVEPNWSVQIEKRIPVAAGLGGGSSDAAAALRLANDTLPEPLSEARLHELAAILGADVPFFLTEGAQLGAEDGTKLSPLELPQDYFVVVVLVHGAQKASTGEVYRAFGARHGPRGFEQRRRTLWKALDEIDKAGDLAKLPPNDLSRSEVADALLELGAFRAEVCGAGPAVYGLFTDSGPRGRVRAQFAGRARCWSAQPTG